MTPWIRASALLFFVSASLSLAGAAASQPALTVHKAASGGQTSYCAYDASSMRCWTNQGRKAFLCIASGCVIQNEIPNYLRQMEEQATPLADPNALIQLGWAECILTWSSAVCFAGDYSATATEDRIQIVDPRNQISDY